ncbi:MAG: S-layer homology domain-containing protein [Oscillospiraceae bacterium]
MNMTKKCISIISAIAVLMSTITIFAAEPQSMQINARYKGGTTTIEVTGTTTPAKPGARAILTVLKPSGTDVPYTMKDFKPAEVKEYIVATTQGTTDDTGAFNFVFRLAEDAPVGYYQIKVSCNGINLPEADRTAQFYHSTKDEIERVLGEVNKATVDTIGEWIMNPVLTLNINAADYDLYKSELNPIIIDFRNALEGQKVTSVEDLSKIINLSMINRLLYNGTLNAEKLDDYGTRLNYNFNEDYQNSKAAIAATMIRNKPTKISTAAEMEKLYSQALALGAVNFSGRLGMSIALEKYKTELELDGTPVYKDYVSMKDKQLEINTALAFKDFKTSGELAIAMRNKIDAIKKGDEKPGGGGSGGGGGGGGSSSGGGGGGTTLEIAPKPKEEKPIAKDVFEDLDTVPWAKESINFLYNLKVIDGINSKTFAPNQYAKREEFVKILINAFGLLKKDAVSEFSDCSPEDWSYAYVSSASTLGIVNGVDEENFGVGKNITREEMVVMIDRTLKKINVNTSNVPNKTVFSDEGDISDFAVESVAKLAGLGIVNGTGNNEFKPNDFCTRAEVATIVYRALELKK